MLYFFRIVFIIFWIFIACLTGIIAGIMRPFDPRNSKVFAKVLTFGRRFYGIKFITKNKKRADKSRPCVFISNHQHNFDVIPASFILPKYTVTIGKKSIIYIPFFGQFFWLAGNILINRKNKKSAYSTLDLAVNVIKEKKISVWIMPEGTRSKGLGLLPFKNGPFITAIKAQVPVVPVVFSSYLNHLNFKKWKVGTIMIDVLPPISTIGLKVEDASKIKEQAYHLMKNALDEMDLEIKKLNE